MKMRFDVDDEFFATSKAAIDLWGDTAPSRWVNLVVGTDDIATLADAVAVWWNVE